MSDGKRGHLAAQSDTSAPAGARPARKRAPRGALRLAQRFETLLELAPDAIVVTDWRGRMRLVNGQTEVLFGYPRQDLLGHPIERLIPERFQQDHERYRAAYGAAPRTRPMGANLPLYGRRRDGSEFPVAVSLAPLVDGDETFVIASIRDASDLHQAQAANEELRRLQALTDTALAHLDLDDLLPELLPRVRDVLQADHVTILMLEVDGQTLAVRAELHQADEAPAWQNVPIGVGFAGRVAASRAPLVVDDLSTFPLVRPQLRQLLHAAMGVPLVAGEHLLGVLCIGTAQVRHFSPQDVALLEHAAVRITTAIERARLFAAEQRARQEAEQARARWQAAMESTPEFVITCDADLRITYVNPAYAQLRGGAADLSVPVDARPARYGLFLPDGVHRFPVEELPMTRAVREAWPVHEVEMLIRPPDGHTAEERLVVWEAAPMYSSEGAVLGAVAIGHDITERRQLEREREAARREAERQAEQLDRVFETMADGVVVYDVLGRVIRTNAAAHRLLGLHAAPPEYRDLPIDERIARYAPRDAQGQLLTSQAWRALRAQRDAPGATGPRQAEAFDLGLRTLDGRELEVSANFALLHDPDGQVVGGVLLLSDRTERNQLEREREAARASELAAREVTERLNTFITTAAHDLRQPVAVTKMALDMAQHRIAQAAASVRGAAKQALPFIQVENDLLASERSLDRLWRLMQQLLDVARARQGSLVLQRQLCDLVALVRVQVEEQRLLTPERTLTLDLPAVETPSGVGLAVHADADRLSQVLSNYLANAVRYAPEDQPIEVSLHVVPSTRQRGGGRVARVSVRDHGPGIAREDQATIWDRFQRAHNASEAKGGLGLGLYIARTIVELHGGQVGVESEVSHGSTFWFTLPLDDRRAN